MRISNQLIAGLLVCSICVTQSGCSTVVPDRQRFSVSASEPDAKIFINGNYLGQGDVQTQVPRDRDISVFVTKDGFISENRIIGNEFSLTGILDIIGGVIILVPFIGLFFPGARQLKQTNIVVVLEKDSAPNQGNTRMQR